MGLFGLRPVWMFGLREEMSRKGRESEDQTGRGPGVKGEVARREGRRIEGDDRVSYVEVIVMGAL